MPNNILSAQINVTAPNVAKTAATVSQSTDKMAASLKKIAPSSDKATFALTNLSRVAQDAPYGFIGIANNLNPLLESFQRLKAETGSTGASLKALGSSLTGAGGVGLALGVVSSLLVVFGDKLFGSNKAAQEAKSSADKLKESINGIFSSVAKEAEQVTTLVAVLKSETETRERKLSAIKELQRIEPEIFKSLKLEGSTVTGLDAAYQSYLANLKTVIAVKIKQAQLDQLLERQLKQQGVTLTKSEQSYKNIADGLKTFRKEQAAAASANNPFAKTEKDAASASQSLSDDIASLISDIGELSKGVSFTPDKAKTTKSLDDLTNQIIARGKELAAAFKDIAFVPEFTIFDTKGQQLEKAKKIIKEFETATLKIKIAPEIDLAGPADVKPVATEFGSMFYSELKNYFDKTEPTDFSLLKALQPKVLSDAEKLGIATAEAFNDGIKSIAANGISALGEGIGAALSGGDIQGAFQGFAAAVAGGLVAIGEQLIAIGSAAVLAKEALKTLFSNPFAAIAAGVALVALGSALKGALSGGLPRRAVGGPVTKGGGYLVGERGPEVFIPNNAGRIVANNRISASNGMSDWGGNVRFEIQCNTLVGFLSKANAYQGRNT